MSDIIYETLDENYPVSGQDNNSQGFRDNFSVIKTGLQTAKSEITVLENNTAKTNASNNFGGNSITNAVTNKIYGLVYDGASSVSNTTIDLEVGEYQTLEITGHHTIIFAGWPDPTEPPQKYARVRVELKGDGNQNPDPITGGWIVTFGTSGGAVLQFLGPFPSPLRVFNDILVVEAWSIDGGATVNIALLGEVETRFLLPTIDDIDDVDVSTTAPTTGQVLRYNGTTWVNDTITLGSTLNLVDITDVVFATTPATGQVLKFDGTNWVNSTDEQGDDLSLDNLNDVDAAAPAANHVLKWDTGTSKWVTGQLDYTNISSTPTLATVATSGDYDDLTNKPSLATVATSGDYDDLTNKPTIPANLDDLGDVALVTPVTTGHVLKFDGTNWVNDVDDDTKYYTGSEELDDADAADLTKSVSWFATGGPETGTLAAGTDGQIKTFIMDTDGGDMVITVTNAGWGGAGTITFNTVGQACTLQYINSKWFCVGNNGATFT